MIHSTSKSGGQYRPPSRTSRVPTPMPAIDEIMCTSENRMATVKGGHLLSMSTSVSPVEPQVAEQAHHFLEQNIKAWMNPNLPQVTYEAPISSPVMSGITQRALQEHNHSYQAHRRAPSCPSNPYSMITPTRLPVPSYRPQQCPHAQVQSHQASAAASFFARAAQKLNLSSRKKRRYHSSAELEPDLPTFSTKFSDCLKISLPPAPPALLRNVGRKDVSGLGKVKVMLRLSPVSSCNESSTSFLTVDSRKKQVTVFDPSSCGYVTPEERRAGVAAPKMFAFDAIFSQDDSQTEVCSSSLTEVIQAVVNGSDGCLFSYGPSKLGKTYTMLGSTESVQSLGIIPCAVTWLYKLINEEKQKTGARFSVRVSAVEVAGRDEVLKDLLLEHANGTENSGTSPGIFLREDPIFGAQLQNQSELRVPNVEKAAYYLDAALAAASGSNDEEERNSHLLFTLHVYQYRVDKSGKGAVAGGRSRLHLLDLGSNERQGKGLSLSAIANVILAIFNGQKHVPYREFKLTQLLREVLGSISCRAAMIAHVTGSLPNYAETLATIQFAARIHRLRRKKLKYSGTSSGESSSEELKFRRHLREGGMRAGSSDPDCTSSSEQSCDTVIYVGQNGLPISDKELTDNEGPPPVPCFPFNQGNVTTERRSPTPKMNSFDLPPPVGNTTVVTNTKKNIAVAADGKKGGKTVLSTGRDVIRSSTPVKPNSVHKGHGKNSLIPVKTKTGSQPCGNGYVDLGPLQNHFLTSDSCQPWPSSAGVNQKAGVGGSDEQWIDGPRISKAWLESRSGLPRRELWIDGPQAIYGWMDRHKRDMIQRWVELQSAQVQGLSSESGELWIDDGAKHKLPNPTDCMSANFGWKDGCMKEYDLKKYRILDKEQPEMYSYNEDELTKSEDSCNNTCSLNPPQAEMLLADIQPCASNHDIFDFENSKSPCVSISDHSPEEPEVNQDENMPELCDEEEFVNGSFIETADGLDGMMENPPVVAMQDSCLQVNEEDIIAACYEFYEEHPLRILSEENLASSFADSFSMSAEMENLSVLESACDENCDHMDEMALKLETMSHFSVPACYSHLSISQTVSKEICRDDASTRSEPINLEPHQILTALRTNICWSGLGRWNETVTLSTCLQSEPITTSHINKVDSSLKHQQCMKAEDITKETEEVYENRLRHPDGASNPDLHKLVEEPMCVNTKLLPSPFDQRSPGNGASYSDSEDEICDEVYPQEDSMTVLKPLHRSGENHLDTGKGGVESLEKCKSMSDHRQKHSKLSLLFSSNKEHRKLLDSHDKSSPKLSSRIPIANCKHKINSKSPFTQSYPENISINPQNAESNKPKKYTKQQVTGIKVPDTSKLNVLSTDHNCHKLLNRNKNGPAVESCDSSPALSVGSCPRSSLNGVSITGNSSSLSSDTTPPSLKLTRKNGPAHQISGTSSGYESMVRDSEGSGSSFSNVEVGTDSSDDEQAKSSKGADLEINIKPCLVAFEVEQYSEEDIERLERRRMLEETLELRRHHRRVLQLRLKQDELRRDLAAAKERLMANPHRWSYDLHVQDNMDVEDPGFLEVLEHETQILEKRVSACQSRVLMVTTFDAKPKALSPANIEA